MPTFLYFTVKKMLQSNYKVTTNLKKNKTVNSAFEQKSFSLRFDCDIIRYIKFDMWTFLFP